MNRSIRRRVLPAAFIVLGFFCTTAALAVESDIQEWERVHSKVSALCRARQYDQALQMTEGMVTLADEQFGPDNPFTGLSLGMLAELHYLHNNYELGRKLSDKAVELMDPGLRESALNPDKYVSDLITGYMSQGDYIPALPYVKWKIYRSLSENGENHPITAMNFSLLAEIYKLQGRFSEADLLYQQSLATLEATIGLNRQETAAVQGSLAELYALEGDLDKALPLYERSLLVTEYTLGSSHPRVMALMSILADIYRKLGHNEAAALLEAKVGKNKRDPSGAKDRRETCCKNIRMLEAAMDLYNMDHSSEPVKSGLITGDYPVFKPSEDMTYLREVPRCPSDGAYHYDGSNYIVTCTKHGTNEKPVIPDDEKAVETAVEVEPKTETTTGTIGSGAQAEEILLDFPEEIQLDIPEEIGIQEEDGNGKKEETAPAEKKK